MGDFGMKVSEPGYDVKTAGDINLTLKTDLTMLKAFAAGSVTLSGDQTIAHDLGYVPQFLVYCWNGSRCYLATGNISAGVAKIDSSNLYILDNAQISAKYYIFYEQA